MAVLSYLSLYLYALACGTLLLLFVLHCIQVAYKRGLRNVPGPVAARFTNLWRIKFVFAGNAHEAYRDLHDKYGPIVRTAPNVVDLSDPRVIPIIYSISSKFPKSKFYTTLSTPYDGKPMESLFSTQDPEHHKALKRPVAQKFSMSSIRTLEPLVDPCSKIFADAMLDLAGTPVDLGVWLQWYAFDVIGAITFNQRFGFMEQQKDIEHMIEGIEGGLFYAGIIGQIPYLHPWLLGNIPLMKIVKKFAPIPDPVDTVSQTVLRCIQEYDQRSSHDTTKRTDFLAFLRQDEKSTGSRMSTRDMMNHLMNNLLAGSDTTAISLRSVFYYVMQDQQVYKILKREIDEADQAGKLSQYITFAESLELPYLQLCLKEAMRMHPGVSYPLERVVPEAGATLCNVYLPPGTVVGVNAAVIHRNTDIFGEDADQFRPTRWIQSEASGSPDVQRMERHLLTFGGGTRTCIGKNISIMEMGKFVPQLLRQFDLEWASQEPTWKVKTWWFARQTGIIARFIPRKKSEPGVV